MIEEGISLDAIFRRNAQRWPDAPALIDPPNRAQFTHGAPRRLTYSETEHAVARLAAILQSLGLPAHEPVAMQLPNTVEAVIALLAVLRAGLVAAPLPLLWRRVDGAAAISQIGACAIITCGRVGDADHGAAALQMAADAFSVRYVCGFGGNLPDGIVALDEIFSGPATPASGRVDETGADAVAAITFDTATGAAAVRGHTALLVGGLTTVLEAELPRHARLLNTILPSSFAALATSVIPWLLTGGTLTLHHPFDGEVLSRQMGEGADGLIVPGPVASRITRDLSHSDTKRIALWRDPQRLGGEMLSDGEATVDVQAFGEAGIVASRRNSDGTPGRFVVGPRRAPNGKTDAPVVMQLGRTTSGTLALDGPMLPLPLSDATADHAASGGALQDTGYPCRVDPLTGALTVTGAPAGQVHVGGYCFLMPVLQEQIARVAENGTLAALPDPLAGQKLAGAVSDPAAMRHALSVLGLNPLVARAFRDPRRATLASPAQ
ncbi:MAG: AMP-binding protein [Variibacter sp.]